MSFPSYQIISSTSKNPKTTSRLYKVYFYNNWHNGDIIFARPLYKKIIESDLFEIIIGSYKNIAYMLEDLVSEHVSLYISDYLDDSDQPKELNYMCPPDFLCFNTWLGQYGEVLPHTWKSTVNIFNRRAAELGISYSIPFDPFDTPMIDFPLRQMEVKSNAIYVENGNTRSGHSDFIFDLEALSRKFPHCHFYCTARPAITADNIIDYSAKNMVELSSLSNQCIAILGKGSGPFLTTYTEVNRFKPRAVCGYKRPKSLPFWNYYNNPLRYLDTMDDVVGFLHSVTFHRPFINNLKQMEEQIDVTLGEVTEMDSNPSQTKMISENIANIVNQYIPKHSYECASELNELKSEGIIKLDRLALSKEKINDITRYFMSIPVFNGHVRSVSDGVRRFINHGAKSFPFGSYALEDILQCPHLLDLALSPSVLGLVEEYLGCVSTIYSINTWWSFPGFPPSVAQTFHRDVDDFKFLTLFIYLTDIKGGIEGGQHQFILKTHREDQLTQMLNGDKELASSLFAPKLKHNGYEKPAELFETLFKSNMRDFTGPAGSAFLVDPFAFHKGVPPMLNDRLVCWIRYGLRKNLTFYNDKTTKAVPIHLLNKRITASDAYSLRVLTTPESVDSPLYNVLTNKGIHQVRLDNFKWNNFSYDFAKKNAAKEESIKLWL